MRARALLPVLPLLLLAAAVPAAYGAAYAALPGDPRCGLPATSAPDAQDLHGDGWVRVAPDGTASWLLPGVTDAAFAGTHSAWVQPLLAGTLDVLCVDGAAVAIGTFGGLAWSPDGTRLAYVAAGVVTVRSGTTSTAVANGYAFAWSPGSDALAVAGDGTVAVHALAGASTTLDTDRYADTVAWAGTSVVYAASSGDGTTHEVVAVHPDGSGRTVLAADATAALAPDGSRVAVAALGGVETIAPDATARVTVPGTGLAPLAFSPDSARLAFATDTAGVTVAAAGTTLTTVVTGAVRGAGWASATEPWFTTQRADESLDLVVGGTTVAHARPGHQLRIVRRDADGSYVVAVAAPRTNPVPRVG
jgi:hypothetical protein